MIFWEILKLLMCTYIKKSAAVASTKIFKTLMYDSSKGIRHFYTQLLHTAEDMIMIPDQASFNERFLNALPSEIKRELVLWDQISVDFSSKDQLWTTMLCVDHMFDSLKAISTYKHNNELSNLSITTNKFQARNKTSHNRFNNAMLQSQPNRMVNQAQTRINMSVPAKSNYTNSTKFTPGSSKSNMPKQKNQANPLGMSKFAPHMNQPSTDKAGNPICFRCGKIGYARDCPKHPYKPRVYALGIAEDAEGIEDLPEQVKDVPNDQIESESSDQEVVNKMEGN